MLKWEKGECGGSNDGPLWFLLRTRNSDPISEGQFMRRTQCVGFLNNNCVYFISLQICYSGATERYKYFFFLLPSHQEIKVLLNYVGNLKLCLFVQSDKKICTMFL